VRSHPNPFILTSGIEILLPEVMMETTIPADLLDLKTRLDQWRANRKYVRQPLPDDLRQAVIAISQRYPGALVRRLLKVDPWRLTRSTTKKLSHASSPKKEQTTFFKLPTDALLPEPLSASMIVADCRLHLERPDGACLKLTLPRLDLDSINRFVATFLRGDKQ
jgi:hypothetical protein